MQLILALLFLAWPQFRGADQNGHAPDSASPPTTWSENENVLWHTPLTGRGWSSPVSDGEHIWLTTAVEREATEEDTAAILADVDPKKHKQFQTIGEVQLKVQQIDAKDGSLVQTLDLASIKRPAHIHKLNSYASPTPVLENGLLYCHFGTFGTFCVDTASGEIKWTRRFEIEHGVGPGSSPFVYDNLLVLICDGVDQQYVVAVDKASGETVWKTDRPEMRAELGDRMKAYCTPLAITTDHPTVPDQLLCLGAQWLISYNPKDGSEVWRLDHGDGFSVVPHPITGHGRVYFSTGFMKPELWAVRTDGSGDVTETHVDWTVTKRIPAKPSPILLGDEIYLTDDGGIASCIDAHTGESHWTERIDGDFSTTPLLANGHLYFCNQEGGTSVIKAAKEFVVVAENQLGSGFMASPITLGNDLILRSKDALYRVGEKK